VIELANDADVGLRGIIYSRDIGRIWRVAERWRFGMVGITTGIISNATVPFGGNQGERTRAVRADMD